MSESNRRPSQCECDALPSELMPHVLFDLLVVNLWDLSTASGLVVDARVAPVAPLFSSSDFPPCATRASNVCRVAARVRRSTLPGGSVVLMPFPITAVVDFLAHVVSFVVEREGFEPSAFCLQSRHSPAELPPHGAHGGIRTHDLLLGRQTL